MAKAGKEIVGLVCINCKSRNYTTVRNKVNLDGKLSVKKFCPKCGKHSKHKETTKLK